MTDVQPTPAGWYPDTSSATPGATRWWDGTQWTEHVQAPPAAAPVSQPAAAYQQPSSQQPSYQQPAYQTAGAYQGVGGPARAPEGTSPVTFQIWAIVGLFALQMIAGVFYLATFDFTGYLQASTDSAVASNPTESFAALQYILTPGYIILMVLSFIAYVGTIVFAFLDSKALAARGVARPFPWALAFVPSYGSMIYVIGRSVVARRRTGSGLAPMWTFLILFVLALVASIIWFVALMTELMNAFPTYG